MEEEGRGEEVRKNVRTSDQQPLSLPSPRAALWGEGTQQNNLEVCATFRAQSSK